MQPTSVDGYKAAEQWKDFSSIEGYEFEDMVGIDDVETDMEYIGEIVAYYTLEGVSLEHPIRGYNIAVYSNGKIRKILVK